MQGNKLVQIFLSESLNPGGVYEVSYTTNKTFVCTCPGFEGRNKCKHVKYVDEKVRANNGTYPLEVSKKVTEEAADRASESPEAFRDFLIKYGKIEVLTKNV